MRLGVFIALFIFLALGGPCYADFYKWVDKDGVVHITDDIMKVPEGLRGKL